MCSWRAVEVARGIRERVHQHRLMHSLPDRSGFFQIPLAGERLKKFEKQHNPCKLSGHNSIRFVDTHDFFRLELVWGHIAIGFSDNNPGFAVRFSVFARMFSTLSILSDPFFSDSSFSPNATTETQSNTVLTSTCNTNFSKNSYRDGVLPSTIVSKYKATSRDSLSSQNFLSSQTC